MDVRGKTYYVELKSGSDTVKYAFNSNAEYEGDVMTALGVKIPEADTKNLIFGLRDPIPRRVSIRYYEDDQAKELKATRTVTRFVADANAIANEIRALKGKTMKVWIGRELKDVEIASAALKRSRKRY
jgi:hypothetical protein